MQRARLPNADRGGCASDSTQLSPYATRCLALGAADAAKAAPDGYTLFMATTGTHSSNISLYPKLPYDPEKDFAPLTLVTIYPQVVVPGEKYPQKSLPELIEALKKAGADANYGSSGVGSPTHLGGELFKRQTGTQMVHVSYRGQVPALNDILGGRLDVMFPSIPDVLSFIHAGQLRALATMAETRSKALPDVPTMGELGHPELVSAIWSGLYTRAGTPQPIIDRLNREKNRHGRFRDSDLLRRLFEATVKRCMDEGLVGGDGFAVDASLIRAEANRQRFHTGEEGLPPDLTSRAVDEYLAVLDDAAFGAATPVVPSRVSPTDPAARYTSAHGGQAQFCYATNYLVDVQHAVIVDVEATTAVRQAEVTAAKRMIERTHDDLGLWPRKLIADTGYGSAEMLAWLVHERDIHPHIPVFDKSAPRRRLRTGRLRL